MRGGKDLLGPTVWEVEQGISQGGLGRARADGSVPVLGFQWPPLPRKHRTFHLTTHRFVLHFIGNSSDGGSLDDTFHLMTAESCDHNGPSQ